MDGRPPRILYFTNSLEQGGAERQLVELIAGLDRARFDPVLVTCTRKNQFDHGLPPERALSLDDPLFPSPVGVARLARCIDRLEPDLVHTFKGWENVFGRVVARVKKVPRLVDSVRTPWLPWSWHLGELLTARLADAHIVNSVGIRDALVRRVGVPEGTITVVENGVDLVRFRPLEADERVRERARRGLGGAPFLVMPGRLSPEKNQLAVVRALAQLKRRGALPAGFKVVLAGRDSLLVYSRRVRLAARLGGVREHLVYAGAVADIERLVAASEGVLLPSWFEGLPNAVIEAMACGVPAIVSEAANADRLIADGVEGLVTTHDVDGIARAIERFLATPADERARMGARGRAHAERRFTVARMVEETQRVYARLLAR